MRVKKIKKLNFLILPSQYNITTTPPAVSSFATCPMPGPVIRRHGPVDRTMSIPSQALQ